MSRLTTKKRLIFQRFERVRILQHLPRQEGVEHALPDSLLPKSKTHTSELTGLILSALCLIIFGPDNFIIPAMAAILGALTLLRRKNTHKEGA